MPPTSIPGSRGTGSALERFKDATFQRDDRWFYFGNDGDFGLRWDASNSELRTTGAVVIRLADDAKLYFGTTSDMYLTYDATSDALFIKGLPIADPGKSDALFVSDTGGSDMRVSAG